MSELQIGDVVKVTGNRGEYGNGMVHYFEDDVIATVEEGKDSKGDYYVVNIEEGSIPSGQFVNEHNLERLPFQPGETVLVRNGGGLGAFDGEETKAEVIEFGGWLGDSIEDRRLVVALADRDWVQTVLVRDMETLPLFEKGDKVRVTGNGDQENDRIEHFFTVGDVGEVIAARDIDGDYLVMVDSTTNYVHESHLGKVIGPEARPCYYGGMCYSCDGSEPEDDEGQGDRQKVEDEPSTYPMLDLSVFKTAGLTTGDVIETGEALDDATNPGHYKFSNGAEVIDITEHLSFNGGNVVKYVCRAGRKGGQEKMIEDLKKAQWYLCREIERQEGLLGS